MTRLIKKYNIFNEELKSSTYISAAQKLKRWHPKRAKEIEDYSKIVKQKEKEEEVNSNYERFSKYPSFEMTLYSASDEVLLTGNFFIWLKLNEDWFSDSILEWQDRKIKHGTPDFGIYAPFTMRIMPSDSETKEKMNGLDIYLDDIEWDGSYMTNEFFIYLNGGTVETQQHGSSPFVAYFSNRKEALKFKNLLLDGFEGRINLWEDKYTVGGLLHQLYEFLSETENHYRFKWKWKDEYNTDRVGTNNPPIIADITYEGIVKSIKNMSLNNFYRD